MADNAQTPAGREERRRAQYVTAEQFAHWRARAVFAFAVLTLVATLAAWLAYDAGRDSDTGLRSNAQEFSLASCIGGGELRIVIARGFDELRTLAIPKGAPVERVRPFIERTQPAIDRLLTQAAGQRYRAPLPPGTVSPDVLNEVRMLARKRCIERVALTFDR